MLSKPPTGTEVEPKTKNDGEGEVPTPPAPQPVAVPPAPAAQVPADDYRTKFGMSTRENQVLRGELEDLNKTLGEITREEIPTDEEMKQKYPEFEYAESLMQSVLKRQEVLDRRQKAVQLTVGRMLGNVTRRDELARVVATNPALAGKETKFIDFASDPKRATVPVETLVSAFLYEVRDENPAPVTPPAPAPETPAPAPAPAPAEQRPSTVLERGNPSGGGNPTVPEKHERTDEELKALRTSNPKEYSRLIRLGQI